MASIPGDPHPRSLGTGTDLIKVFGTVRGQGQLQFWGFLGRNPQKTLNFGAGIGATFSRILPTLILVSGSSEAVPL